jgi:hypothetical protein
MIVVLVDTLPESPPIRKKTHKGDVDGQVALDGRRETIGLERINRHREVNDGTYIFQRFTQACDDVGKEEISEPHFTKW